MAKAPKAPSGLGISRNDNRFTCSWSRGAKYTSQSYCYDLNRGADTYVSVGSSTTSRTETIAISRWYPKTDTKWTSFRFYIRGKKSGKWSSWSSKEYTITTPPKPKVEVSHSDDSDNKTIFRWEIDRGDNNKLAVPAIFTNCQWWTSILPNSELDSDQVTEWQETGTTTDWTENGDKTIIESDIFEDNYSYTRYFKIVARGPAGDSAPAYGKYVYAFPNPARNVEARAEKLETNQGYRVSVKWSADATKSRPIDSVLLQYAVEVPNSSSEVIDGVRKVTLSVPNISSWTTASTLQDSKDSENDVSSAAFIIPTNIEADKCIFVRVVTKHDNQETPSDIVFVDRGYGLLANPTGFSATISDNIATISVNNNSSITASWVGIYYRTSIEPTPRLIGVYSSSSPTVTLPDPGEASEVSLGIRTFVADYSPSSPALTGVTEYATGDIIMASSGIIWDERPVPKPPTNITLASPKTGVVRVTWDWTWTSANGVEISWANHDDAWESTDEPQNYSLENTRASAWNIAGLESGTWYFRVRLFKIDADNRTYGTYSDIKSIKIAATPPTPVLTVSPAVVQPDGKVTCYWAFSATDGDDQAHADIREAVLNDQGVPVSYTDLGIKAENEQYKSIDISTLGWEAGTTHYLSVKIITISGEESDNWSIPKPVKVLEPITCTITSTSLEDITVIDDEEQQISHVQKSLTEMPLTVSATGAGESGKITYILERADDYHLDRPDESEFTGYNGETIAIIQKSAVNEPNEEANYDVNINLSDLIGPLDDNAKYNLIAIAQDSNGQISDPTTIPFEVHWSHKAVMPLAIVEPDKYSLVTYITPIQPTGYEAGDTCDIYRLSTDLPELIVKDAVLGTKYVDQYPTLGNMGGHRIVYKTAAGSYMTEDREFAWMDYDYEVGNFIDRFATVIDYGKDQVILPYDLALSSRWGKDFTMTKYLGGSVEGDWNPAIERTGTVRTRVAVQQDSELISSMRRLANFAGICHVRTPDGSSFAANVNVSEDREERKINMIASFSLEITKVDSESFDGITYDEWIAE